MNYTAVSASFRAADVKYKNSFVDRKTPTRPSETTRKDLTARQTEILRCMVEDLSASEIAHKLGISPRTVEYHQLHMRERLGVRGIAGIIRWAIRSGLIEP